MNIINKVNKYLLEQYPLIWNTRLIWMIIINLLVHFIFLIIGYSSVNSLEDLKEEYKLNAYFYERAPVYYNFLISIFIILVWFIFYLKNNAFKSLYAVKRGMLFQQFFIIIFIIFISTSQFYSFKLGLTTKVKSLYSWEEVDKDLKRFNELRIFLPINQSDYEIDKRQSPDPFPLKVDIQKKSAEFNNIDLNKPYIELNETLYQFYKQDKKQYQKDKAIEEYSVNLTIYDTKYRIVKDASKFKDFIHPSLYNYSKQEFIYGQDSIDYKSQLEYQKSILENENEFIIKNELKTFLLLANKYKTKHNLTVDNWFSIINNQPNYLLKELINPSNPLKEAYNQVGYNNRKSKYFIDNIPFSRTLFFSFNDADNFFKNVHSSYYPKFDIELLYFLLVFSFVLGILIFIFKTTNIKTLLLSFVASLVVLVLVVWLMSSSRIIFTNSVARESIIMIFISFLIIFLSIASYVLKWKKILISIFWSLVLFAVPTFFLFVSLFYSRYLREIFLSEFPKNYGYKSEFEIWFDNYGFWSIMLIWILTVYVYSLFIRRLKARAE